MRSARGSACDGCGYSADDWLASDNAIGPLQTDKEGNQTPFEQTICYAIEQGLAAKASSARSYPACILAFKGSMTQADMNNFLNGTVNGKNVSSSVNATELQDWLKCASAENRKLRLASGGCTIFARASVWAGNLTIIRL